MEEKIAMLMDFSKEKFDIIIQAGQSNADGSAHGPVEDYYEPNANVWYMNGNFVITEAVERVIYGNEIRGNFSLSFSREYINNGLLGEGRKLLILRTAVGGTGFLDNRWKLTDDLYLRMMEMIRTALALNPENRLVALLWHQGETDALCKASYEVHYHHLMTLLKSVREEFGVPELPFVAGDFVQQWKNDNIGICTPVVDAIRAVCRDCEKGSFVESEGLLSNAQEVYPNNTRLTDTIHFSRRSIYELGKRYFEAYSRLIAD